MPQFLRPQLLSQTLFQAKVVEKAKVEAILNIK